MVVLKGKDLNKEVYSIIRQNWPIHASDICRQLHLDLSVSNISKIKYHYGLLEKDKKIRTKKVDRALIAWPADIEKIRMIHDFMSDIE